jgi:hypothetical protein
MQKPLPLPLPHPLNYTAHSLQDLHVEITSRTLSRWNELMVHQTINVKEFQELFDCPSFASPMLDTMLLN